MRRRLALMVLAVTTMVTLSFSIPFAAVIKTVVADQALIAADQESQSLAGVLGATASPAELTTFISQLNAGSTEQATVILPGGERIGSSIRVPADDLALARSGRAFTSSWDGETHVLVPVRQSNGQVSIGVVDVPRGLLRHGVLFAWVILGVVSLFIVVLGILVADRLGRSLVSSVGALGVATRRLQRGELDARVELEGPPEVREVGETLNNLAGRIVEMLDREREAAADLSHRLRTPLMALQLEADAVTNEADRNRIQMAIGELTQAVTAVIRAARVERADGAEVKSDLSAIAAERIAFWSVLADEQGRRWTSHLAPSPLVVGAAPAELVAALDALLTNVFAHTAEGVGFLIRTELLDGSPVLVIEDAGPGFADALAAERGRSGGGSTGLGLDIVSQAARGAGGELILGRSAMGGASVTVRFGAAD